LVFDEVISGAELLRNFSDDVSFGTQEYVVILDHVGLVRDRLCFVIRLEHPSSVPYYFIYFLSIKKLTSKIRFTLTYIS